MGTSERFEGMTAVVTGGASGIGFAVSRRFLAEGGRVTLWDVDPARLDAATAELGAKAPAACRRHRSRRRRARSEDAGAAMGHIDALVCSAGVAGQNAHVIDYPVAEWKRVFDINVNGLFYCNRFVARLMKARGYGRIVNISSIAGKEGNPTASPIAPRKRRSSASPSRSARNSPRTASPSMRSRRRRSRRRSSNRSPRESSPTCARKFRWSGSAPSRRQPR